MTKLVICISYSMSRGSCKDYRRCNTNSHSYLGIQEAYLFSCLAAMRCLQMTWGYGILSLAPIPTPTPTTTNPHTYDIRPYANPATRYSDLSQNSNTNPNPALLLRTSQPRCISPPGLPRSPQPVHTPSGQLAYHYDAFVHCSLHSSSLHTPQTCGTPNTLQFQPPSPPSTSPTRFASTLPPSLCPPLSAVHHSPQYLVS
jgi:hypothetical protein